MKLHPHSTAAFVKVAVFMLGSISQAAVLMPVFGVVLPIGVCAEHRA